MSDISPLLQVRDLSVRFGTQARPLTAVNQLSFSVAAGETLAIVGESGCGKSVTALALTRLLAPDVSVSGSISLGGRDINRLNAREMRAIRGRHMGIVFQDSMAALNPVMTIGDQLVEAIQAHEKLPHRAALSRAEELLGLVRIPEARRRLADYPHRFSGGMRQRVAIAIALAGKPSLLIADEPTTALDVTIQAQILTLLIGLQRELGMAMILITHDFGVMAEVADRVLVMYAGRKVEEQAVRGLFSSPRHPYTRGLMAARPQLQREAAPRSQRLQEIPGMVPMLSQLPAGCAFAPRCPHADAACAAVPALQASVKGVEVACHHAFIPDFVPAAGVSLAAAVPRQQLQAARPAPDSHTDFVALAA